VGFVPERVIFIQDFGLEPFDYPADLFVYEDRLYVVDTGNDRIVVLDGGLVPVEVLDEWTDGEKAYALSAPEGVHIRNGEMFIADTGNGRVLRVGLDGTFIAEYGRPQGEVIPRGFHYRPSKLVVDRSGHMYVLATGVWQGLVTLDPDGNFVGFFGSNRVKVTFAMIIRQFWRRISTREQTEAMERFVPVEISNIAIDANDFIFTVTQGSTDMWTQTADKIQKINPVGNNILRYNSEDHRNSGGTVYARNMYGDVEFDFYRTRMVDSILIDIHVDEDGLFAALDRERGRVFVYDPESNPLFIFGGIGEQAGTFSIPSALTKMNGRYIVADGRRNSLTVFAPTEYALLLKEATALYNEGLFIEALPLWEQILSINSNQTLAYRSIGKAYLQQNRYREALANFRLGEDRTGYNMAFREYRKEFIQNNLLWILLTIILSSIALRFLFKFIFRILGITREKRSIMLK
jgi:hypothetical protein